MATHADVKKEHNYPAFDLWLILLKKTDERHGLTLKQMREEMARAFQDNPNYPNFKSKETRSIQNYLKYLENHRILGTQVRKVDVKELKEQGVTDYRRGTYITPIVDRGIATLIATMLRSSRLNAGFVSETLDMLCNLTAEDTVLPTLAKPESSDVPQMNAPLLALVRDLMEAIAADRAVTFEYANYNVFGELSYVDELNPRAMTASTRFVDPYAVVVKNDRFYLIGHLHENAMPAGPHVAGSPMGLQYYALDHMRNMHIKEDAICIHMSEWDVNGASRHDTKLAPFDPVAFVNERTHMVFGPLRKLQLRVNDDMLGQLRDDYGHLIEDTKHSPDSTDPNTWYIVTLQAAEEDMRMWLLEHAARQGAFAFNPESFMHSMVDITRRHASQYLRLQKKLEPLRNHARNSEVTAATVRG